MSVAGDSTPATVPAAPATAPSAAPIEPPAPPALSDAKPRDYPGLHNVVAYHEGFLSGSVPEGDAGFAVLEAMGIRTIISVDGAEPEVEKARAHGIRYIHLPIGYNGFDEQRKLELVRASRDALAQGPVYMHCHHGKHRSAGAAGTVAVSLGWLTPPNAVERMKVSGTAADYTGLYECTAKAEVLDPTAIDAVPASFPEVSHPATFVKSMVRIDEINDQLKLIEKAGWAVPRDHPDLTPTALAPPALAAEMADLFRIVAAGDKATSRPMEFAAALRADSDRITALEEALAAPVPAGGQRDTKRLSEMFKAIQASCKECHAKYRDLEKPE